MKFFLSSNGLFSAQQFSCHVKNVVVNRIIDIYVRNSVVDSLVLLMN